MSFLRGLLAPCGRLARWTAVAAVLLWVALPPAAAAPRPAPPFTLALLDGGTFRLSGPPGTAVVLLFWAPW